MPQNNLPNIQFSSGSLTHFIAESVRKVADGCQIVPTPFRHNLPVDRIRLSGRIRVAFAERTLCQRSINWFGRTGYSNLAKAKPPFWKNVHRNEGFVFWCGRCRRRSRILHSEKSRGSGFPMGRKLPCTYRERDILCRNTPSCWFAVVGFETCRGCVTKSFGEHSTPPVSMGENRHVAGTVPRKYKKPPQKAQRERNKLFNRRTLCGVLPKNIWDALPLAKNN